MKKRTKQRNRAQSGFTLAETLMALLILLLATAVVATGVPAAIRVYYDVVDAANAEVLLSTTMTALREELGSTGGFTLGDKDADGYNPLVSYKSSTLQGRSAELKSYNGSEAGSSEYKGIKVECITDDDLSWNLVSGAAATKRLHAEFTGITYDEENQVFIVSGLQVKRNTDDKLLSEAPEEYLIRPMNPIIIEN